MTTMQQTTAPLTRRQAREIERRTGVRPVAIAAESPLAAFAAADFQHDTGEIARNAVASLVSVVPTEIVDRNAVAAALQAPAAGQQERMTVRVQKPASLVAKQRRRSAAAGFAVAASALAAVAAVTPLAQPDQTQASAHQANLADVAQPAPADAEQAAPAPAAPVADRVITDVVEAPAAVVDRVSTVDEAVAPAEEAPVAATGETSADAGISTGTSTDGSFDTASAVEYSSVYPMPGGVMNEGYGTRGGAHKGLDIVSTSGGTCGASLVAVESGTVISAAYNGGWGNTVEIMLDSGNKLLYGHLEGFAVSAGQQVSAGDVIGYAGNTGNSYGCHLHFEVYEGSSTIDPSPWLAARGL